jgi:uncharacterized protein with NRDE domain
VAHAHVPDRLDDAPILAGRDLQAGGSWLGVSAAGHCAAVTNMRDPRDPQQGLSRGRLVAGFLEVDSGAAMHAQRLLPTATAYRPFNLLVFGAQTACCVCNRPAAAMQTIAPGLHGLSNAQLDTPWPKTRALQQRLQQWLDAGGDEAGGDEDFAPLFDALADEHVAADAQLPDTGVSLARERALSPAFIRGEQYGTRASTVVALGHDGGGCIIERRFGPNGRFDGQTLLRFSNRTGGAMSV